MSTFIPAGSIVKVQVGDAQSINSLNSDDVVRAVSAELAAEGLPVRSSTTSGGFFSTITPLINESFQATLLIQPNQDTDSDSLTWQVSQAFLDVTQKVVTQVTIPSFTPSGASTPTSTGQPSSAPTVTQSISDSLSAFFSGLKSTTIAVLIGLAAIIIIVLVLAAYGPNVGKALS